MLCTALQGTPYLIFWDVEEAKRSSRKILDVAPVLYPGHDRPFRQSGGQIEYLKPTSIRFAGPLEPLANDVAVEPISACRRHSRPRALEQPTASAEATGR